MLYTTLVLKPNAKGHMNIQLQPGEGNVGSSMISSHWWVNAEIRHLKTCLDSLFSSCCFAKFCFDPGRHKLQQRGRSEEGGDQTGDRLLWVLHNTNILARVNIAPLGVTVKVSQSLIPFHCGDDVRSAEQSGSDRHEINQNNKDWTSRRTE